MERAIEAVREMPPETQDEVARIMLQLTGEDEPVVDLTPEEEAALEESIAQADRGEFATDQEIHAIWTKHKL